ncbi:hypothetical protein C8R44DRAFT_924598, partial [Mycena epipterygia]
GPRACTNCRRRKIKCNGARPVCDQCTLRPPRSREPCVYPQLDLHTQENPNQMLQTIQALQARVAELEYLAPTDPSGVYLGQPYGSRGPGGSATNMPEPPPNLIANLIDTFLDRFAGSGYFFIDPHRFRQSALLPLPFGHRDRPSPALLSAVYLWGSVLSHVTPDAPYTPEAFLVCVLQNIPQDITGFGGNPKLVLQTIQAEVLVSFYYLHMASPVHGRYHSAVAASIALGAELHLIRSPQQPPQYPIFALRTPLLPRPESSSDEATRINAWWAVVILNNYWVGAEGSPSALPYGIPIDTPWPSSSHVAEFIAFQKKGYLTMFRAARQSQSS